MKQAYTFHFRLIPSLICLLFFALFIRLGVWQWQRFHYKLDLEQRYLAGQIADQQSQWLGIPEVVALGNDAHSYPVRLSGQFLPEFTFLLDNQPQDKQAGLHVLSVLQTISGEFVLVNRGWMPWGKARSLPEIPLPLVGELQVSGQVYIPSEKQFVLQEDDLSAATAPYLVQKLDLGAFGQLIGVELAPFVVRASASASLEQSLSLVRDWQFVVMSAEKSRAYSFQWFAMAFALAVMYLFFSIEKRPNDEPRSINQ